ncbi:MAG: hypothetical protein QM778_06710 [Myxococcales bacterium]
MQLAANARARVPWRSYSKGERTAEQRRDDLSRQWQRSKRLHINKELTGAKHLSVHDAERVLRDHYAFASAARPYLEALSSAAGLREHTVMVTSPDGVVVDSRESVLGHEDPGSHFACGTLLGEAYVGSNGVGTALAEARYVEVSGREHFIRGFHRNTCHGVPLLSPELDVAGALCLAVQEAALADRLQPLFALTAIGIEAELHAVSLMERFGRLRAERDPQAQTIALLHQDLVQSQTAARLQVELGAKRIFTSQGELLLRAASDSLAAYLSGAAAFSLASDVLQKNSMSARDFIVSTVNLLQVEARSARVPLTAAWEVGPRAAQGMVTMPVARWLIVDTQEAIRRAAEMHFGRVVLRVERDLGIAVDVFADGQRQSSRTVPFRARPRAA